MKWSICVCFKFIAVIAIIECRHLEDMISDAASNNIWKPLSGTTRKPHSIDHKHEVETLPDTARKVIDVKVGKNDNINTLEGIPHFHGSKLHDDIVHLQEIQEPLHVIHEISPEHVAGSSKDNTHTDDWTETAANDNAFFKSLGIEKGTALKDNQEDRTQTGGHTTANIDELQAGMSPGDKTILNPSNVHDNSDGDGEISRNNNIVPSIRNEDLNAVVKNMSPKQVNDKLGQIDDTNDVSNQNNNHDYNENDVNSAVSQWDEGGDKNTNIQGSHELADGNISPPKGNAYDLPVSDSLSNNKQSNKITDKEFQNKINNKNDHNTDYKNKDANVDARNHEVNTNNQINSANLENNARNPYKYPDVGNNNDNAFNTADGNLKQKSETNDNVGAVDSGQISVFNDVEKADKNGIDQQITNGDDIFSSRTNLGLYDDRISDQQYEPSIVGNERKFENGILDNRPNTNDVNDYGTLNRNVVNSDRKQTVDNLRRNSNGDDGQYVKNNPNYNPADNQNENTFHRQYDYPNGNIEHNQYVENNNLLNKPEAGNNQFDNRDQGQVIGNYNGNFVDNTYIDNRNNRHYIGKDKRYNNDNVQYIDNNLINNRADGQFVRNNQINNRADGQSAGNDPKYNRGNVQYVDNNFINNRADGQYAGNYPMNNRADGQYVRNDQINNRADGQYVGNDQITDRADGQYADNYPMNNLADGQYHGNDQINNRADGQNVRNDQINNRADGQYAGNYPMNNRGDGQYVGNDQLNNRADGQYFRNDQTFNNDNRQYVENYPMNNRNNGQYPNHNRNNVQTNLRNNVLANNNQFNTNTDPDLSSLQGNVNNNNINANGRIYNYPDQQGQGTVSNTNTNINENGRNVDISGYQNLPRPQYNQLGTNAGGRTDQYSRVPYSDSGNGGNQQGVSYNPDDINNQHNLWNKNNVQNTMNRNGQINDMGSNTRPQNQARIVQQNIEPNTDNTVLQANVKENFVERRQDTIPQPTPYTTLAVPTFKDDEWAYYDDEIKAEVDDVTTTPASKKAKGDIGPLSIFTNDIKYQRFPKPMSVKLLKEKILGKPQKKLYVLEESDVKLFSRVRQISAIYTMEDNVLYLSLLYRNIFSRECKQIKKFQMGKLIGNTDIAMFEKDVKDGKTERVLFFTENPDDYVYFMSCTDMNTSPYACRDSYYVSLDTTHDPPNQFPWMEAARELKTKMNLTFEDPRFIFNFVLMPCVWDKNKER